MLYFYKSISPHSIENLHTYMDFFFQKLFAEVHPTYEHAHYIHPDFQEIIDSYKEQIDDRLAKVFKAYNSIKTAKNKVLVQTIYKNNNDIEGICNNTLRPYKYQEMPKCMIIPIKELYDSNGVLYKMLTSKTGYVTLPIFGL